VKLDWMMLANHAEVGANGLLYVNGGGWDTITVGGPLPGVPDEVAAIMVGALAIRILFHVTETDRTHHFEITILGEDGQTVGQVGIDLNVPHDENVPPGWLQNWNFVLPVTGVALPQPGLYTINLTVNGQWLGDRPFRVVKAYEDGGDLGASA
jgi:hypothetical protein